MQSSEAMLQQHSTFVQRLVSDTDHLLVPHRLAHSHWMSHVPFAFWMVAAARPRLLVELGSYTGVSFCAFCQQVAQLGLDASCYAVDSWQGDANMGQYSEAVYEDLQVHVAETYPTFASLIRTSFDEALELFADNSIDLLHIDGYHAYEAMLHDVETWLPKMSPAGVILMHDITARIPGYGGVRAWQELQKRFPSFTFTHGYGLGVLLTGENPPPRLKELVQCGQDENTATAVRRYFSRLGALYERCNELHGNARNAIDKTSKAEGLVREYEKRLHECRQGYMQSISWRITAPLRFFGASVRRLLHRVG